MPRYFFHHRDGEEFIDREGTDLAGSADARAQAVILSGELLRDTGSKFWGGHEWHLWVTDEAGEAVCGLRFTAE